jgi:hypothetical protein
VLGTVAHRTLELLLRSPPEDPDQWEAIAAVHWQEAIVEVASRGAEPPAPSPSRRTLARICRVAIPAIRGLVLAAGRDPHLNCELPLAAFEEHLIGRADLIIDGQRDLVLVDYKTGLVSENGELRPAYIAQLRLYAAMIHNALGRWPNKAMLVSLRQGVVDVAVEPDACDELAQEAVRLLTAYNALAPGPQPAKPSTEVCLACPVSEHCNAFWLTIRPFSDAAGSRRHSVEGTVVGDLEPASWGVAAIRVQVVRGTLDPSERIVTHVPFDTAQQLSPGTLVRLVDLDMEPRTRQLQVTDRTRLVW